MLSSTCCSICSMLTNTRYFISMITNIYYSNYFVLFVVFSSTLCCLTFIIPSTPWQSMLTNIYYSTYATIKNNSFPSFCFHYFLLNIYYLFHIILKYHFKHLKFYSNTTRLLDRIKKSIFSVWKRTLFRFQC